VKKRLAVILDEQLDQMIHEIRGQRVMLDSDLARVYGVTTKRLNEQFRRNRDRFPEDFAFRLTAEEAQTLRSQNATGSAGPRSNRSQIATGSQKHRDPRYRPYAFTEHGALQAANILNSERAVQMSVFVIRAFVKMRSALLGTRELAKKLRQLEKQLTKRLDAHELAIFDVLQELMNILNPPPELTQPKPQIGFQHK
jgi:hypothetical protein